MRSLLKKSPSPLRAIISVVAVFTLLAVPVVISRVAAAASAETAQHTSGHLVTIHDRGEQKVILTSAKTVGEAIKQAGISLDPKDAVEPAASQEIPVGDYQVNIYRARPVTVIDGTVRKKVMTPYQTPEQIAKDAGITLYDEDKATLSLSNNILSEGAGLEMTITRATPITFVQYGKTITVRTQGKTVADMLQEKGIVLAKDDTLSVPLSTVITAGMRVELWRNGVQTVTQDEDIPFDIQQIQDADQTIGYSAVKTPGVVGKKTVTYQVDMKNGQEISRTVIQSVTTEQPKSQVEVIGVKPKSGTPSENRVLGHNMMLAAGFSDSQWTCLNSLWTKESGWDQYKANYSGSGAYGIPQALPGSKMGPGWQDDAVAQISWGLGYIRDVYGTPCGAWAHSQSVGWY